MKRNRPQKTTQQEKPQRAQTAWDVVWSREQKDR